MIGFLSGKILHIEDNMAIVVAHGVGYEVFLHDRMIKNIHGNNQVSIYIHHHIREDAQTLFGFIDHKEKMLFRKLLKINGVGPKLAIAILAYLEPQAFIQAVIAEDYVSLNTVKGLGAKVAKRLVMDLKPILIGEGFNVNSSLSKDGNNTSYWQDAVLVLSRLGYKTHHAEKLVRDVQDEAKDLDHLIRLALKSVAKETSGIKS